MSKHAKPWAESLRTYDALWAVLPRTKYPRHRKTGPAK